MNFIYLAQKVSYALECQAKGSNYKLQLDKNAD